jgi:hypothetical protein
MEKIVKRGIPNILLEIKQYLEQSKLTLYSKNNDGRVNSIVSEEIVIDTIQKKFKDSLNVPKIRSWYDILVKEDKEWLPVNIKITTTKTNDNIGNLAPCLYAYTDYPMRLHKNYNNGVISKILVKKLENKEYNNDPKRDYWFIVINKLDGTVIINSVLGLVKLHPNINNLPFQIKWKDNAKYSFSDGCEKEINKKIKLFINVLKKPKPSWKEEFMTSIRNLSIN